MTTRTGPLTSLIADRCRVLARRVRGLLDELDYAQRRMLELRTGYVFTPEERARRAHTEVRRLERLLDAAPSERRRHPRPDCDVVERYLRPATTAR